MSVLMHANREWERRPADERFGSLRSMYDAAIRFRDNAAEAEVAYSDLRVIATGDDVSIVGPTGQEARLNHWSFGQLAGASKSPAGFLRDLEPGTAATVLNERLAGVPSVDSDGNPSKALVLFNRNGGLTARALTSTKYSRIWNADVVERLMRLEAEGPFQPAPAAFDGSRGLYLGDRDMFAFLVDSNRRIFEKAPGGGLSRGFFVWNSEVGARSIGVTTFYYAFICGNHIVWQVSDVKEMRVAHIHTDQDRAWSKIAVELRKYAESSAADDEAKIERARTYEIGASKEDVLNAVFKFITRNHAAAAYDLAEQHESWYGSPRSAWGMMNGITELARDLPNADERSALDRAGAKVMQMAF